MANVMFKRGTQSSLETLLAKQGTAGSYVEGAFYLTTDSDRLYFAQSDSELVHLNHNVIHVDEIKNLPALADAVVGDFYYCVKENVLCTKKAGGSEWVQINKNTDNDNDTSVTGLTATSSVDAANNVITLSYAVKQTFKNLLTNASSAVADVTASVTLSQEDLNKVLDLATDVTASVSGGVATVKTKGNGSGGDGFTITGKGSVTVGGSADAITITGTNTTYAISKPANDANITLTGSDNKTSKVAMNAGTDLAVDHTKAGEVIYKHGTVTHTQTTPAQASVSHGGTFTAISDITVSETGHVTGSTKQVYKLPADKYAKAIAADKTGANGTITVTMADNSTFQDTNALFYKILNVDGTTDTFYNGATLDVYSKGDIDDKFLGLNAMTYKGVVGSVAIPTSGVHIGDTYMVDKAGTYGGHSCKIGDLLIATGTETNGVITGTVTWTMVPSANDTDSQFALSAAAGGQITLKNTTANKTVGTVTIEGDATSGTAASDEIIVTTTTGSSGKIKIAHAAHTTSEIGDGTTKNLSHSGTFDVLTAVQATNGHITGYKTQTFKLPSDNNTTYALSTGGTTDAATIILTGNNNTTDSITIAGGSRIDTTTGTDKITIAHEAITVNKNDETATASNLSHSGTFEAITAITSSDGHLEGYTVKKFKLPSDNNTTNSTLSQSTAISGDVTTTSGNTATITTSIKDSANKTLSATTVVKSNSLAVKAYDTNKGFEINLEWGSF